MQELETRVGVCLEVGGAASVGDVCAKTDDIRSGRQTPGRILFEQFFAAIIIVR